MKLRTKTPIIICALHLLRSVAPAATILTGPGDFAVPTTLVDFETFPGGGIVPYNNDTPGLLTNQWRSVGILISDSSPGDGAGAYSGTYEVRPHSGTRAVANSYTGSPGGFIDFRFVIPGTTTIATVGEAGIWIQNGDASSTVSFFDANGMLIQSLTPPIGDQFAGFRAAEGIASIRISDSGYFMVDDLQFAAVPNPSFDLQATIHVSAVDICWPGRTNTMYQVQYRSNLSGTNWFDFGSPILGTGTNCVTDGINGMEQRFYRIIRVP